MQISYVDKDAIDDIWPRLLPMIERGLSHGQGDSMHASEMLPDLMSGLSQLWVAHDGPTLYGGVVLSVQGTRKKKVWIEMLAGRDLPSWIDDIQSALAEFSRIVGAEYLEASCRPGLAKKLARHGWREQAKIMRLKT